MQLWYKGNNTIEIKTKASTIVMGQKDSRVNDVMLVGPGEYEISDVEVRGFSSGAYVIKSEGLSAVYLDGATSLSKEEVGELGDVDVLFLPAEHPELITVIDPKIVIPVGEGLAAFCKAQTCDAPVKTVKIVAKDIAEAEHKIIVLDA